MCNIILSKLLSFLCRMTTKLVNDNTEAFYRISHLYYRLGEEEDSLRWAQCMHTILCASMEYMHSLH